MGDTAVNDDLSMLATWAEALLAKLGDSQRRQLNRQIAQDLRRSQCQRIASQRAPDHSNYVPRKHRKDLRAKKGRIKRQKAAMFVKLRTNKYLKTQQDANLVTVGFFGRIARIARVHQDGLKDKVTKNGVEYQYPARPLLGFSPEDHAIIRESFLRHLRD
jgi:phage virion morphogenesis protein